MRPIVLALLCLAVTGCVCGTVTVSGKDGGADSGVADSGAPVDGGEVDAGRDAGSCIDGESCGDGGVCAGGACCAQDLACGSACCASGTLCSFQTCVTPGASCRDSTDCPSGWFCDLARATPGTSDGGACIAAPTPGQCLPRPLQCGPDAGSAVGRSCVEACRFPPPEGGFSPVERYSWGQVVTAPYSSDVMMAPVVTQLDDDDCDGRVTAQDMPDLALVTFAGGAYTMTGVVHALSVKNGALVEKWSVPGVIGAWSQLASGNIDGVNGNELVGCDTGRVVALRGDGGVLWNTTTTRACQAPSLADLDGDGQVEVITEGEVLAGLNGARLGDLPFSANNVVADLDGDGKLDVISASAAAKADRSVLATVSGPAGFVAVGDLDKNGLPEVVTVNSSTHTMSIWTYDAAQPTKGRIVRANVDVNATLDPARCPAGSSGNAGGGGPPTIGDFNGDGYPDVALAGGIGYAVFDGRKLMDGTPAANTLLWIRPTQDCSSAATGSTLFDFDGDGRVEAVYGDEVNLHVYDSATGAERFTTCNTSGTLIEYPLVADVDNDGQADLVVVSNAYAFACGAPATKYSGVRVFSSANRDWVVTRRIWNQHAYAVTNVEEDGTIPRQQRSNWLVPGLNNFRQNKQPGLEFAAADAVVQMSGVCESGVGITYTVTVRNVGEATMPPGVSVEIVVNPSTNPRVLTTLTTPRSLGPTQAHRFTFLTTEASVGSAPVIARIVAGTVRECRTDNNTSEPPTVACIN